MSTLPAGVAPAEPPEPRPSALGVLVRRGGSGWEVLLGRRARASRFMPGHLAFPGGMLDPADRRGAGSVDEALRRCAAREVAEETGFDVPPGAWRDLGERTTPPIFPVRFRTRFFLAELPPDARLPDSPPSPGELEWLGLVRPAEVLKAWSAGGERIPPPVLPLLRALAGAGDGTLEELAERLAGVNRREDALPRVEFIPGIWMLPVRTLTLPPATHTNVWMPGGRRAVFVDAGTEDEGELQRLEALAARRRDEEGAGITGLVLTHHHPDHATGAAALAARLGVPLWAHPETLRRLDPAAGVQTRALEDGAVLDLDGLRAVARFTPGHAPGHLALEVPERRALISGDLVSGLSTILVDPEEGDMGAYLRSLEAMEALDVDVLLPSHGPPLRKAALRRVREHRLRRHEAIRRAWERGVRDLDALARIAYEDTPEAPPALARAQTRSHLKWLQAGGRR